MREATQEEISNWDALILANPGGGQILQTNTWGNFKSQQGWKPRRYIHKTSAGEMAAQYLERQIPGLGSIWYSSRGPGVAEQAQFLEIVGQMNTTPAFLVKFDPEILEDKADTSAFLQAGLLRSKEDIQLNRATIIVDLKPAEDEIIASFKQKARYNVRLAERKGVTIEAVPPSDSNLDAMFKLYREMMHRTGFFMRPADYFKGYWKAQAEAGQGQLFLARHEGDLLAGAFVTYLGSRAWYKDGGSIRTKRELMAPYLMQWEIMRWLKAKGVNSYDLVAVPPKEELTPKHYMYGLYQFKSGFNSEITQYIGTWDLPLQASKYQLWAGGGERLYRKYLAKVRKELLY